MGTTIYNQLPYEIKKKYFGCIKTQEYERRYNVNLPILRRKYGTVEKISIDHIPLDDLLEVGILNKDDITNLKCVGFMRNSLDRFMSICNYEKKSPDIIIDEIKNGRDLTQVLHFKQKNPWNIYIFNYDDKARIKSWFKKQFNIDLDLTKKDNISKKTYIAENLTQNQLKFIRNYFREDDQLISIIKRSPRPFKYFKISL
tara:strand:- start:28 stop:627 length:600 start_codon:yes stop_codon:yes gene_type:complete